MTETRKCPPLGTGSVDFGALHAADARNEDLVEAIEEATTYVLPPQPLTGKESLARLQEIAAEESVELAADATRADIAAAIEAHRNPPPPPEPEAAAETGAADAGGDA